MTHTHTLSLSFRLHRSNFAHLLQKSPVIARRRFLPSSPPPPLPLLCRPWPGPSRFIFVGRFVSRRRRRRERRDCGGVRREKSFRRMTEISGDDCTLRNDRTAISRGPCATFNEARPPCRRNGAPSSRGVAPGQPGRHGHLVFSYARIRSVSQLRASSCK